jgi:signal transduction histidine kinase
VDVVLGLGEKMPSISADQGQLQQVILNLLTNARDAMPEGGRLELTTSKTQFNGQEFVELCVSDTGKGIDPEHFDKLFEPFFTTKPEGVGTGLGLSICQGIIESHGGSISAESELERGTTFIIQLPTELKEDNSGQ